MWQWCIDYYLCLFAVGGVAYVCFVDFVRYHDVYITGVVINCVYIVGVCCGVVFMCDVGAGDAECVYYQVCGVGCWHVDAECVYNDAALADSICGFLLLVCALCIFVIMLVVLVVVSLLLLCRVTVVVVMYQCVFVGVIFVVVADVLLCICIVLLSESLLFLVTLAC